MGYQGRSAKALQFFEDVGKVRALHDFTTLFTNSGSTMWSAAVSLTGFSKC